MLIIWWVSMITTIAEAHNHDDQCVLTTTMISNMVTAMTAIQVY